MPKKAQEEKGIRRERKRPGRGFKNWLDKRLIFPNGVRG